MTLTIASGLAVLTIVAMIAILVDRGLPNTAERLGIFLIRFAARLRARRLEIQRLQREELGRAF